MDGERRSKWDRRKEGGGRGREGEGGAMSYEVERNTII